MAVTWLLILLLAIFILFYYASRRFKYGNLPPGPLGIPFLGSLPFLGTNPEITILKMKKKYGKLWTLYLGSEPVVVLNDWSVIKEALVLNANSFNGRPKFYFIDKLTRYRDVVFSEGLIWKAKRRISLSILRDFGFGKSALEKNIVDEVQSFINHLKSTGLELTISKTFSIPLLNIVWCLIAGKRLSYKDKEIGNIVRDMDFIVKAAASGGAVNIFGFLKYLPQFSVKNALDCSERIHEFCRIAIEEHKKTYEPSECRDLIDGYLTKTLYNKDPSLEYDDEDLQAIILDFFLAGVETTDTVLCWIILYLTKYQDVLEKAHKEIDSVIGPDRTPDYSDRTNLPYMMSIIAEVNRLASVFPLSLPYKTMKDVVFQGYGIPKGTQVWANLLSVHYDKGLWGDPENFRPERFLNNNEFKEPEYLVPFSIGSRQCLGESVARMEIVIFLAMLLQNFTFKLPKNEKSPSFEKESGVTTKPYPFKVIFEPRIK